MPRYPDWVSARRRGFHLSPESISTDFTSPPIRSAAIRARASRERAGRLNTSASSPCRTDPHRDLRRRTPGAADFYRAARRLAASSPAAIRMRRGLRWCMPLALASVMSITSGAPLCVRSPRLARTLRNADAGQPMEGFSLRNAGDEHRNHCRRMSPTSPDFQLRLSHEGCRPVCLVTDANRAVGMPPGRYRFGPLETGSWFESDGRVGFVTGSGLARSGSRHGTPWFAT